MKQPTFFLFTNNEKEPRTRRNAGPNWWPWGDQCGVPANSVTGSHDNRVTLSATPA